MKPVKKTAKPKRATRDARAAARRARPPRVAARKPVAKAKPSRAAAAKGAAPKPRATPPRAQALVAPEVSGAERTRAGEVLARLERAYPDWGPTLRFTTPLDLLVATILAAQATDEAVNRVTEDLFQRCRSAEDYVRMPDAELERIVHPLGFFRQKAKAVKLACQGLLEQFGGEVPRSIDELTQLHGVGRKTASIVLGAAYRVPSVAVDRHVARVAQRLGFTKLSDPDKIELDLRARYAEKDWIRLTWNLVLHGRRVCRPLPECPRCTVNDLCPYPNKTRA